MHLWTSSISLAGSGTPPVRLAPHILRRRTIPAVKAGSCGGRVNGELRKQKVCVPGSAKTGTVGLCVAEDPQHARMSELR